MPNSSSLMQGSVSLARPSLPLSPIRRGKLAPSHSTTPAPELTGGQGDGLYGLSIYGTNLEGTYTVTVEASGVDETGSTFDLTESGSVELGPKVDGDANGISDVTETRLGLDPSDPTDAAQDPDCDGLTTALEFSIGTDPFTADSDGGGEPDGAEHARGTNRGSIGRFAAPGDGRGSPGR